MSGHTSPPQAETFWSCHPPEYPREYHESPLLQVVEPGLSDTFVCLTVCIAGRGDHRRRSALAFYIPLHPVPLSSVKRRL